MSILDDQKRARKGAKALLRLLLDKSNFDANLDAYTAADGIIDRDFLNHLEKMRPAFQSVDEESLSERIDGMPPAFQEAMLEHLIEQERFDLLAKLRDSSKNKPLVKSIKQRLHALKTKGVDIAKKEPKAWKLGVAGEDVDLACLVTAYDVRGQRIILWPQKEPGGIRVMQVLETDRAGIANYQLSHVSRSRLKELCQQVRATSPDRTFEIDEPTAHWLIRRAMRRKTSKTSPEGFTTSLSYMTAPETAPERHPFFEHFKPIELEKQDARVKDSAKILDHDLARGWSIGQRELRDFQIKLNRVAPTLEQAREPANRSKVNATIDEAIDEYFTDEMREAFAQRLMDTAWFLAQQGDKNLALTAFATAESLTSDQQAASRVPFCRDLIARLLPTDDDAADAPEIITT
ncbi:MAG: hypothetical protein H6683_02320 [Deltaproteobacteria bacterium]|nr:hypothetical protein [Deltaproteobacteria bacterium]MCB9478492.1 hypothetical protein [Deltaproteobacteria bacterium]